MTTEQEYVIKCPKNEHRNYHMMRFNGIVDFSTWTNVKLEREAVKDSKSGGFDDVQPKFGAGSEYGKEQKDEMRRKKYGTSKAKLDDQPWLLNANNKKFRGVREGGVSENAAYYVFAHSNDQLIEAYSLKDWYKFQTVQCYKALTAEEAELEFSKRTKYINHYSLMVRKRLKIDENGEDDDDTLDGVKTAAGSKRKNKSSQNQDLKISEMDEWINSSDESSGDSETGANADVDDTDDRAPKKKKNPKKASMVKKKAKNQSDSEAFEESDDGDGEGREMDYISDSTNSDDNTTLEKQLQGVGDEKGLRKLLTSDEGEEESDDENAANANKTKAGAAAAGAGNPTDDKNNQSTTSKKNNESNKTDDVKSMNSLIEIDVATPKPVSTLSLSASAAAAASSSSSSKLQHDSDLTEEKSRKSKKKKKKHRSSGHHHHSSKKHELLSGKKNKEKDSNSSDECQIEDSSDDEVPEVTAATATATATTTATTPGHGSLSHTVPGEHLKRKMISECGNSLKRMKLDLSTGGGGGGGSSSGSFSSISSDTGINEEAVRRYLMRKPMTTTELLQKFKSKKTGLSSDQLVNTLTQILKKINPVKQTIKNKMYLSLKSS